MIFALAIWLAHFTRLGSYIYALGGNMQSAALLGVPVGLTTVSIYALSSTLAALSGVVYSFYTASGSALSGVGLELDAVRRHPHQRRLRLVAGTIIGVMTMGLIQTWNGALNSWWTKIFTGALMLGFIVLQRWMCIGAQPTRRHI